MPAFTGLGAPHWDQYARGTIVGLTRDARVVERKKAGLHKARRAPQFSKR